MRIEKKVVSVSWIPSEAIEGMTKLPFEMGVAKYDDPPPDKLDDPGALVKADLARFANELRAWIEVEDGRIVDHGYSGQGHINVSTLSIGKREMAFQAVPYPLLQKDPIVEDDRVVFTQTAGGRTGLAAPRRVSRPPYVQVTAPSAWTTLTLTISANGFDACDLVGASPFPRHWIYGNDGTLIGKSAAIDFKTWYRESFGSNSPWGDLDSPALLAQVESELERELSLQIMRGGKEPEIRSIDAGEALVEQGHEGSDIYLLLDGLLDVEVDGKQIADVGPGAIVGQRAILEGGKRTATLRAVTRCKVAIAHAEDIDRDAIAEIAEGQRREER